MLCRIFLRLEPVCHCLTLTYMNQVPDSELDSWMESRIYPVMSDVPALSDLITSMVASGYDYRRDDDAGLWSSADLTYVITYEM